MIDQKERPDISQSQNPNAEIKTLDALMSAWGTCPTLFLSIGVGDRYPGKPGILALAVLWMFSYASPLWFCFFWLWIVALIYARLNRDKRQLSYYTGHKRVRGLPLVNSECKAVMVECLICFAVGIGFMHVDESFGLFILSWCGPLLYVEAARQFEERRMRRAIRDNSINARWAASINRMEV